MASTDPELVPTPRTRLRRQRERGSHQRHQIHEVLDAGLVAHVGFAADHGPVVLPMTYARIDDLIYLHGAAGNDMLRHLDNGTSVCFTVTIVDGLVFARSAFHHSMNYRSVVLFGKTSRVTDPAEVRRAAAALLDHLAAGRAAEARPPNDSEVQSTMVLRLPITEGSAKIRTGGPIEESDDLRLPVWAGVLPVAIMAGEPSPDHGVTPSQPVPDYVRRHPLRP